MPKLADLSTTALLDAFASAEPTPGGGSAAGIAGAMGAALLAMVAGLPRTRGNTDAERTTLAGLRPALIAGRDRLRELADVDTEAFDAVMAAYKLPKATDAEKATRSQAIQVALRQATAVPLETVRACAEALQAARTVAAIGNPSAASDAGVAIGLLGAAAQGAALNVRINLDSIKDEDYQARTARQLEAAIAAAEADGAAARAAL
jgi:formiminotetrahydrofolate cyclodeaminase